MARNRGKKALYEVMSRARSKGQGPLVSDRSDGSDRPGPGQSTVEPKTEPAMAKIAAKWWRKPRVVQLNAGRIEFSIPYQIGVAAGLVLVLALLASYRLGQFSGLAGPSGPAAASGQVQSRGEGVPPSDRRQDARDTSAQKLTSRTGSDPSTSSGQAVPPPVVPADPAFRAGARNDGPPKTEKVETPVSTGDNVIVLAHYHTMADLQPVQVHFAEHGIMTEIVPEGGRYVLQTKQRYQSTAPGSDGGKAIEKIREVGALYKGKAPPDYEAFAPHYFSDAYGKKVK